MKTSNLIWGVLFLLMGSLTTQVSAQKHLEALVRKFDADKSMDKNVIRQRDPNTKALTQVIRSYDFKENPSLAQDVKKVFEQDRDDAYQAIENERDGKLSYFFQFSKDKGSISYSLDMNEKSDKCSITIIENFHDSKPEAVKKPDAESTM